MSHRPTALITGGSRGIGRGIVTYFAKGGYDCIFTYLHNRAAAEETVASVKAQVPSAAIEGIQLDTRDPEAVDSATQILLDGREQIHVLVNNAAITRNKAAALMTNQEWREVLDTNLSGPFYMIRALLMHFITNRFGRIINILSLATQGSSGQINYAASKAGLESMTYTVAREYGAKNITSNGVMVGLVATDMTSGEETAPLKKLWEEFCPIKRLSTAEEVASSVYFLASDEANCINGHIIKVTGGFNHAPY